MNGRLWTSEEDALVRKLYARARGKLANLLPHRSKAALSRRASLLAVPRRKNRWTPAEDRALAIEWGEVGPRTLRQKLPGRTWVAIVFRARQLGLGSASQNTVSLDEAARRTGYHRATLRKILAAEGVAVRPLHSGVHAERRVISRDQVDPVEAADAVKRHLERARSVETLRDAAERVGLDRMTLRRQLAHLGVVPGRQGSSMRLDPAMVDRAAGLARDAMARGRA